MTADFRVTLELDGLPVAGGFTQVSLLGGILRLERGLLRPGALPADRRITLTVILHDLTGAEALRQSHRGLRLRSMLSVEQDGWLAVDEATLSP